VEGDNVTYRATYIIDEDGIVQHESINNMPIGRNVGEYLRLVDALTHVQEKGEVCPANWEEGKSEQLMQTNNTLQTQNIQIPNNGVANVWYLEFSF